MQIKSKKRVAERGEVFTAEREVKAMCDLVVQKCDRVDSRFLEPVCGNGNFLAEILTRKLVTVKKLYKSNPYNYERYSVWAVASVYGVDIMQDNLVPSPTFGILKVFSASRAQSANATERSGV